RHDDRRHAVHDALVMSRGAVRVCSSEFVGADDAVAYVLTANGVRLPYAAGSREPAVRQIRQNAQIDATTRPLGDMRSQRFGHGIDGVRPHGVASVHDQVGNHHGAAGGTYDPDFQFAEASAQAHQHRVAGVADAAYVLDALKYRQAAAFRIADVDQLDLGNHAGA